MEKERGAEEEEEEVEEPFLKRKDVVNQCFRAQGLCESRGGRPWAPVPNKPTVSVDVKQHSANQPTSAWSSE